VGGFGAQKLIDLEGVLKNIWMNPFSGGGEVAKLCNLIASPFVAFLYETLVVVFLSIKEIQVERVVGHKSKFAARLHRCNIQAKCS
jgi:hypothetical protein